MHVRVYSGSLANLPKQYVSREKLCLNATAEFYVNTFEGMPLMVIAGELNEKLKIAIEKAIIKLKELYPAVPEKAKPRFTLVFDREAYEPEWFKKLWKEDQIAVLTYRKNVKDKWEKSWFQNIKTKVHNTDVTMSICEMGTLINKAWFREVRKLSENGHQTAILTTHPDLKESEIASYMFSRWTQENFFNTKSLSKSINQIYFWIASGCAVAMTTSATVIATALAGSNPE